MVQLTAKRQTAGQQRRTWADGDYGTAQDALSVMVENIGEVHPDSITENEIEVAKTALLAGGNVSVGDLFFRMERRSA
jgi:hypothetical protein